jgi:hypothetical protein
MKRPFVLFAALACWCMSLLTVWGDFIAYVAEPDRDVWVAPPDPGLRVAQVAAVALAFATGCTVHFLLIGKFLPCYRMARLGAVASLGFTPIVYVYGASRRSSAAGYCTWCTTSYRGARRVWGVRPAACRSGGLTAVAAVCAVQVKRALWGSGEDTESVC